MTRLGFVGARRRRRAAVGTEVGRRSTQARSARRHRFDRGLNRRRRRAGHRGGGGRRCRRARPGRQVGAGRGDTEVQRSGRRLFGARPRSAATSRGGPAGGGGRRLFGLNRPAQAVTVGLPADAVCLSVLDGGRVALHTNPELDTQVERFFIREPELSAELVDADLLRQLALRSSLQGRARRCDWPPARFPILAHRRRYREPGREIRTHVVPAAAP